MKKLCPITSQEFEADRITEHCSTHADFTPYARVDLGGVFMMDAEYCQLTATEVVGTNVVDAKNFSLRIDDMSIPIKLGFVTGKFDVPDYSTGAYIGKNHFMALVDKLTSRSNYELNWQGIILQLAMIGANCDFSEKDNTSEVVLLPARPSDVDEDDYTVFNINTFNTLAKALVPGYTFRKMFASPYLNAIVNDMYQNHPHFRQLRQEGTPVTNQAGCPAGEFWKVLSINTKNANSSTMSATDRRIHAVRLGNIRPPSADTIAVSTKWDPDGELVDQQVDDVDPDYRLDAIFNRKRKKNVVRNGG